MPDTPMPGLLDSARIVRLETTLYGSNGGGLESKTKDHDMRLRKLEVAQARIGVLAGLVSGGIVAAVIKLLGG
jgi:hypothetical protein